MKPTWLVIALVFLTFPLNGEEESAAGPAVLDDVRPIIFDRDLRDLPTVDLSKPASFVPGKRLPEWEGYVARGELSVPELVEPPKELVPGQVESSGNEAQAAPLAGPGVSFPGIGFASIFPPDTHGDVGPSHYLQVVNANPGVSSLFRIWNKAGTPLAGPTTIASLWPSGSGPCSVSGFDPEVLYD